MPFYEYQCKSCGHELEAMQKVSDPPLKKCPDCGKSQLQRLMSAPVFRLKGGGWYETDFKGDKDNQRNLADRPEADAPKDTKEADSTAKDDKGAKDEKGKEGKDAKTAETKVSEAASAKESATKEKSADKSSDKSTEKSTEKSSRSTSAQKPAHANRSSRGGRLKKKSIKVKRRR
jgi:putative FmdB family regulatory protein